MKFKLNLHLWLELVAEAGEKDMTFQVEEAKFLKGLDKERAYLL